MTVWREVPQAGVGRARQATAWPGVDVRRYGRTRVQIVHRVLRGLLRLWHLNRWLELQCTAELWPRHTFLLTLNKRRLLP
jgi:hypothetical protein